MDYSDYLDIEIVASRKGILPSQLLSGEIPRPMNLRVYTEQEKSGGINTTTQKKEKQGQSGMCNQKKAEKSHGEKIKETSSAGRTLKDADDTVSERKLLNVTPELCKEAP